MAGASAPVFVGASDERRDEDVRGHRHEPDEREPHERGSTTTTSCERAGGVTEGVRGSDAAPEKGRGGRVRAWVRAATCGADVDEHEHDEHEHDEHELRACMSTDTGNRAWMDGDEARADQGVRNLVRRQTKKAPTRRNREGPEAGSRRAIDPAGVLCFAASVYGFRWPSTSTSTARSTTKSTTAPDTPTHDPRVSRRASMGEEDLQTPKTQTPLARTRRGAGYGGASGLSWPRTADELHEEPLLVGGARAFVDKDRAYDPGGCRRGARPRRRAVSMSCKEAYVQTPTPPEPGVGRVKENIQWAGSDVEPHTSGVRGCPALLSLRYAAAALIAGDLQ
ncbi:hypothetical protein C8R46DRAFT_1040856 [Mycena filopes]|nr:hypothetical protein C8R46DRAFT_1040856 [Mycena filopes]